jgi:hypothetical protein
VELAKYKKQHIIPVIYIYIRISYEKIHKVSFGLEGEIRITEKHAFRFDKA